VAVAGDTAHVVQWQVSTNDGATWSDLAGETFLSLTLTATEDVDGNMYRAVATNEHGTAVSDAAMLTVRPTIVATPTPSPTPSDAPSPTPTAPAGNDDASSGFPSWAWIGGGFTLLLLVLALVVAALRRRRD
jgi:hypothetical protein